MIWTTAEVFLPYQHAGRTPETNFLSTWAMGLRGCKPGPVKGDKQLHKNANKKQHFNYLIKKIELNYSFILYLRFIYSFLTKIFYYNKLIIKLYNIKKIKNKFKRHIFTTNCPQVMLIKHELTPIDTNYFHGGIRFVH